MRVPPSLALAGRRAASGALLSLDVGQTSGVYNDNDDPSGPPRLRRFAY